MSNEEVRARIIANLTSTNLDDADQSEVPERKISRENESANMKEKNAPKYPFQFLFKALSSSSNKQERSGLNRHSVFTAIELSL